MLQAEYKIEKKRIAESFGQAAKSYDKYASLQREVADNLLGRMESDKAVVRVLDLGSGTGYCTEKLSHKYPEAEIISLDLAEAMLSFAKQQKASLETQQKYICGDAENLPFMDNSFDLVYSSLAIQWCQNYSKLFSELQRVLVPSGKIFIATFGPGTLKELEKAWQKIDSYIHVNQFYSEKEYRNRLVETGFNDIDIQQEVFKSYYKSFNELGRELKSIGARNMNSGRGRGLNSRKKILTLKNAFESNFELGYGIPVNYQTQYIMAQK